jgi:hypothetical protein
MRPAGILAPGYGEPVRWELLFADLEAFAEATERWAFEADVADRARAERAALTLADRVRGHVGGTLAFRLADGDRIRARVADVGADWVLLEDGAPVVLPMRAVAGIEGLSRCAAHPAGALARRVGLGIVLRRLSRDRAAVQVGLLGGGTVTGTIDRVGADHLDVAQHPADVARRAGEVQGVVVVRLAAVAQVRSAGS